MLKFKKGLYTKEDCLPLDNEDLENKILVLNPEVLKDEYKRPEYQICKAFGGFGCSPTARGRRVFVKCLYDSEEISWYREDFIGILKEELVKELKGGI